MIEYKIRDKSLKKMFTTKMAHSLFMDGRVKETNRVWFAINGYLLPLQYIRKNDRMNTKIYVWDIIKNWFAWVRVVQECSWWFELLWIDREYKDSHYMISALNSECMVFGNIYENPEILEEYNKIPKVKYDTDYLFPNKC